MYLLSLSQFIIEYFIIILVTFAMAILSFLQTNKFYHRIPYNSLLNPIFIYTPVYFILFVMMRIGAYNRFTPRYFYMDLVSRTTPMESLAAAI